MTDPTIDALREAAVPIDMVLFCPACGEQHIDAPEESLGKRFLDPGAKEWGNPPHRSHLCASCGYIWRPADVPTNGVVATKTKGKADSGQWVTALQAANARESSAIALLDEVEAEISACGAKFREYQASHAAKQTADADAKAMTNEVMAMRCEGLVSKLQQARGDRG